MELPNFLSREGKSLVFNQDNSTFVFFIPAVYFNNSAKVQIAEVNGQYVSTIGVCDWAIIDKNGKMGKVRPFLFPTMFLCKPRTISSPTKIKLTEDSDETDYILLKFQKGDEVISDTRVPQLIDNVEIFFKMAIMTAKIPTSVPYDKIWELFFESASLNGFSYNLNVQLFHLMIAAICRDKNDISKQFNSTDMSNMNAYKLINIKTVPKYISPYAALTSENWDESVRAAILMKDDPNTKESPLEKVVTG